MPIDPNSETSDIGMMYRQYLQSKGMPLTQGNMQSVIAQSQREPGMIAGLGVQQADTPSPMNAPPPPNIAGASAKSSGGAMPIPPTPPTGIPVTAPLPHAPFPAPTQGPSMAPQGAQPDPASAPISLDSLAPGAQAQTPQTPPPGQAPTPSQSIGNAPGQGIAETLAALGGGSGILALVHKLFGGGSAPPAAAVPPSAVTPASVASAVNKGTPVAPTNAVKPPTASTTTPSVGESAPPSSGVAAAIEKSVPTAPQAANTNKAGAIMEAPYEPAYMRRGMPGPQQGPVTAPPRNSNPYPIDDGVSIPPVRPSPEIPASLQRQANGLHQGPPIGPKPVQGPPIGPRPMQGPPEMQGPPRPMQGPPELHGPPTIDGATVPIGNILYDKPVGPQPQQPQAHNIEASDPLQSHKWLGEGVDPMQRFVDVPVKPVVGSAGHYPGATRLRGVRSLRLP